MGQEVTILHAWTMVTKTNPKYHRKMRAMKFLLKKVWFRNENIVRKGVVCGCLLSVRPPRGRRSVLPEQFRSKASVIGSLFSNLKSVQFFSLKVKSLGSNANGSSRDGLCKALHGQELDGHPGKH